MKSTIRRARPVEAERLTEIAHAAKRYWNYPEAWIREWRDPLTVTRASIETQRMFVAEADGVIAGFYALSGAGPVVELEHLWIDPGYIGRGLGRRLVEHCKREARARGAERIEIDSDPHAEPFYVRVGAHRIGGTPAPMEGDESRYLPRLALVLVS